MIKLKGLRMKESKQEYESLRNEIIALEEIQRNVWLYMYMIFCSLFGGCK